MKWQENNLQITGGSRITYLRKQPEVEAQGASIHHFRHGYSSAPQRICRRWVAQNYHRISEPPHLSYKKQ